MDFTKQINTTQEGLLRQISGTANSAEGHTKCIQWCQAYLLFARANLILSEEDAQRIMNARDEEKHKTRPDGFVIPSCPDNTDKPVDAIAYQKEI